MSEQGTNQTPNQTPNQNQNQTTPPTNNNNLSKQGNMVRLGINGFGRVGRLVTRIALKNPETTVVAVNDPNLTIDAMVYLFKYDSIHGSWKGEVSRTDTHLVIDGVEILVFHERTPEDIPWKEAKPEIICESAGLFRRKELCMKHFIGNDTIQNVVMSAPPKHEDQSDPKNITPMFVYGVNHDSYTTDMKVVSNASCSTNGLSPIAKVLNDKFGIVQGFVSVVHSTTGNQMVVDGPAKGGKDWRAGRAAGCNIIPATTGAATAVAKIIPALQGKLDGLAYRVPVGDVSLVDFSCRLEKETTYEEIKQCIKEASEGEMKGIIGYTEDLVVSQDMLGQTNSTIFDATAGMGLGPNFFKLVMWYDNEFGYSTRLVDLAVHVFKMNKK